MTGIAVGVSILVIALCAGLIGVGVCGGNAMHWLTWKLQLTARDSVDNMERFLNTTLDQLSALTLYNINGAQVCLCTDWPIMQSVAI